MALNIPHVFVNGVIAEASEVNSNFSAVKLFVDGVAAGTNLTVGAVTTAKIADGAVTTVKLAAAAVTADKLAPGAGGGSPLEIQVFS
jgi:hypothetical protein